MTILGRIFYTLLALSIVFIFAQEAGAKKHTKIEKVGKVKPDKVRKNLNKKLKVKIPAGQYTDIELADLVREDFGASLVPVRERGKKRKVKKIKGVTK